MPGNYISFSTPTEALFFIESDPYNFTTDNRPLGQLLANDIALDAAIKAVQDEVVEARGGFPLIGLDETIYPTLDDRLDAMDLTIAALPTDEIASLQNHQYGDFIVNAEALRRASPSGWLDHNGLADLAVGDAYDDFAAIRTTPNLGVLYEDTVVLWTGWGATYKPVRALVNGWIVRLYNEVAGSPPTIPSNHVTIHLGAAPETGNFTDFVYLECWLERIPKDTPDFVKNGAVNTNAIPDSVEDPLDTEAIYTVKAMIEGGDWIQLRHRIRVFRIENFEDSNNPNGFTTTNYAQGSEAAPVTGYPFAWMGEIADDAGLWRAGDGTQDSIDDLGTFDGYVYAIPMMMAHRWNQEEYAVATQNGTVSPLSPSSGNMASELSGHPAGMFYDAIDQRDILDMRNKVSLWGFDLKSELERSWQMLTRGELRSMWKPNVYDSDNNGVFTEETGVWGHTLTTVDSIANTPETFTNPLRDRAVVGAPLAEPDGQRTVWSKNPQIIYIKFGFTQGTALSAFPSNLVTYDPANEALTFNAATLSPGGGTGATKLGSVPPTILRKSNLASQPGVSASGLGTQVATARLTGLAAGADYVGYIPVVYPGGSGVTYPQRQILRSEVIDGGVTLYPDEQFGTTGVPSAAGLAAPTSVALSADGLFYFVADRNNHRVVKIDPTDWSIDAQFGVTGVSGADNTHCSLPTGLCVDSATGNVYVCDANNHRIIRLSSSLAYTNQFGVTAVSGADATHLNNPSYVTTDGSNVYASDTNNHRVIKLPMALSSISAQFGVTGIPGALSSGLNGPSGVAVVSAGFGAGVWISDTNNNRVAVVNSSMVFQYQICDQQNRNTIVFTRIRMAKKYTVGAETFLYVLCSDAPDGPCLYQFNENFALVRKFGVPGQPGSAQDRLNFPSGFAVDAANNALYVADAFNHRLLKLNATTLAYVSQYGITGVTLPGPSRPVSVLCPGPADVEVDSAGNVYVVCNDVHVVKKLNTSLVQTAIFGTWGVPAGSTTNFGLRNPLGVAVKPDGSMVWVVDTGNTRVVRLNGSLAYQGHFTPQYTTSSLPRATLTGDYGLGYGIADVAYYYDSGTPANSRWYITTRERYLGTNSGFLDHTILRFTDAPANTPGTANYDQRIVSPVPYPTGLFVDATSIYTGSVDVGVVIYERATPTNYIFTKNSLTTIRFRFNDVRGIFSNGTQVMVAEPAVSAIHIFDADAGIYRGSAGVLYEEGSDNAHLFGPHQGIIHGKYLVIVDTYNQRLFRRHYCAPWVAKDGSITTLKPPVGADQIHLYYDREAYQGLFGSYAVPAAEAIYKSQVKVESNALYATTMGLGTSMTNRYSEFLHLHGMTYRLPLPLGWTDYSIFPIGMKTGTVDEDDDSPYLVCPVTTAEGFLGGQVAILPSGQSSLSSRQALQQVVRTVATTTGRGYRSVLPTDQIRPRKVVVETPLLSGGQRIVGTPSLGGGAQKEVQVENFFETIRYGTPPVRSDNLLEAVPHLTAFPFLYQRQGICTLAVITTATYGKAVSVGDPVNTAVDLYFPFRRLLMRS